MNTLEREGLKLVYDDRGQGEPPMLFVHGWCCDHEFFASQVEHFSRSHRTVAVDLLGHGASDKPEQEYTLEGHADELAWVCEQLGLRKPIVIGHSRGASIALLLAGRYPDLPSAIVLIDGGTRTIEHGPEPTTFESIKGELSGDDYREMAGRDIDAMFLPSTDPGLQSWVRERMLATPRHVMASARAYSRAWDARPAAAACKVPVLYIQAATPRPELEAFRKLCPQLVVGRTVGAGHFNMLEVPEQVNPMIERFLAISV
jgi:pimeloyl-ACP methyl ester carboxylesterase